MIEHQCGKEVARNFSDGRLNLLDKRSCMMEHRYGNAVAHNFNNRSG